VPRTDHYIRTFHQVLVDHGRLCLALTLSVALHAAEHHVLLDFEAERDLRTFNDKHGSAALSGKHATHGERSMRIAPNEYLSAWRRLPGDWSGWDELVLDVHVDGDAPLRCLVVIGDEAWRADNSYWNRHNSSHPLRPGDNRLVLPVDGLYRGEAGSRNNDISRNIDADAIVRVDFGFRAPDEGVRAVYLDHLRLQRSRPPADVLALDFGPQQQALWPGFEPLSWDDVLADDGRVGLWRSGGHPNRARDDTFPTRLYGDHLNLRHLRLLCRLEPGRYHLWWVFSDLGYWGGEVARHRERWLWAEGDRIWSEDRGADGPVDHLFRFEDREPALDSDLWELYGAELFAPHRASVQLDDGELDLRFGADQAHGARIAALVIYPDAQREAAETWLAAVEAEQRAEFHRRAVHLPQNPAPSPPPGMAEKPLWLGEATIDQPLSFNEAPGKACERFATTALRGQRTVFSFACRPSAEQAGVRLRLRCDGLDGPQGLDSDRIELRYAHHGTQRGFNSLSYRIVARNWRRLPAEGIELGAGQTRQFTLAVSLPDDATAGHYHGWLELQFGAHKATLPIDIDVLDHRLLEADFSVGLFGFRVPQGFSDERRDASMDELLQMLRAAGLNTISGGPNVRFGGFTDDGRPALDFGAVDRFMRAAKAAGFTRPLHSYGGPARIAGLHGRYVVGAQGRRWAEEQNAPFPDLLARSWKELLGHAEQDRWLPVRYYFCDEPRVEEPAREQLTLMRLYQERVPELHIGGSYSVHWDRDRAIDHVHQDMFRALDFSVLNIHGPRDLDEAERLGKELFIYNQGRSRYSFGLYQWAELRKGVRGRIQWHLLALHGYQYFDLDGREPDTAMINWGRTTIHPSVDFERLRAGMIDFRLAATLWHLAGERDGAAADEARRWLDALAARIPIGARKRPEELPDDDAFRAGCLERIGILLDP